MRSVTGVLALLGIVSVSSTAALAQPLQQYAFNIPKTNPEAFVAWRRILPQPLRSQGWIYRLEVTASPYTTVNLNGVRYLYGWFCKPHDCGMNSVAFLMAENGIRATGLYVMGMQPGAREIQLGNPTPEEMVLLRAKINY